MTTAVAVICSAILMFAAGFHYYWGFGGRAGIGVSLPQRPDGKPIAAYSAVGALGVAVVFSAVMAFVLAQAGIIALPLPPAWIRAGVAIWALLFTVRALSWYRYAGLFKSVRNTEFARFDTWLYSPLYLLLGIGLALLALTPTES